MFDAAEDLIGEEITAVLQGLRPGLVHDLADLDGSSLEGLNAAVHVMPFGDRAILEAYDLVSIEREGSRSKTMALPELIDATRAAAISRSFWER